MNKTLIAAVALFLSFNATAQSPLTIGVKGGLNFTSLSSNSFSSKAATSYVIGAYAEKYFSKKWGLQTEVTFTPATFTKSDGFDRIYANLQTSSETTAKIYYVNIPLLLSYKLNNTFSFQLGPQLSLATASDENLFRNGTAAFKNSDISVVGGAKVDLTGAKLFARYQLGLTNINNYDNRDTWKNRQFSLGIELPVFKLKK